jgi:hypothetical protein
MRRKTTMDLDSRHRFAEIEGCRLHWVELGESNRQIRRSCCFMGSLTAI